MEGAGSVTWRLQLQGEKVGLSRGLGVVAAGTCRPVV